MKYLHPYQADRAIVAHCHILSTKLKDKCESCELIEHRPISEERTSIPRWPDFQSWQIHQISGPYALCAEILRDLTRNTDSNSPRRNWLVWTSVIGVIGVSLVVDDKRGTHTQTKSSRSSPSGPPFCPAANPRLVERQPAVKRLIITPSHILLRLEVSCPHRSRVGHPFPDQIIVSREELVLVFSGRVLLLPTPESRDPLLAEDLPSTPKSPNGRLIPFAFFFHLCIHCLSVLCSLQFSSLLLFFFPGRLHPSIGPPPSSTPATRYPETRFCLNPSPNPGLVAPLSQ